MLNVDIRVSDLNIVYSIQIFLRLTINVNITPKRGNGLLPVADFILESNTDIAARKFCAFLALLQGMKPCTAGLIDKYFDTL
jgi:hypothetical protein